MRSKTRFGDWRPEVVEATCVKALMIVFFTAVFGCKGKQPAIREEASPRSTARSAPVTWPPWNVGSQPLYSDADAEALVDAAARVVPNGQARPRDAVLKALGIETSRLRNQRIFAMMSVSVERWDLSPGYEVSWMIGRKDEELIRSKGCPVYGVQVRPRR